LLGRVTGGDEVGTFFFFNVNCENKIYYYNNNACVARIGAAAVVENGLQSWSLSGGREEQVIDNCEVYKSADCRCCARRPREFHGSADAFDDIICHRFCSLTFDLRARSVQARGIDAFVEHTKKTPYLYYNNNI